jgi:capsid portal protein
VPRFIGALAAIETSTEIGKFHLNNILNNLTSSAISNFNNGEPSEEQKKMIEKKLNDKFSGANNAGKNMIVFNNSKEEAVTIERLGEDNFDKKFETLSKSTREEIFISFRATPALFGLNPENNGFSKAEFLESFELYNKCVVKPIQNDIKRVFDKLFNMENSIQFKKFTLEDEINMA